MTRTRKLTAVALSAVFLLAFAVGFLAMPQPAEACIAHPSCPGFGCVDRGYKCVNGWWCDTYYCRDGGAIVDVVSCTNYPC